jgi:hypothetical protein
MDRWCTSASTVALSSLEGRDSFLVQFQLPRLLEWSRFEFSSSYILPPAFDGCTSVPVWLSDTASRLQILKSTGPSLVRSREL